MVVDNRTLRFIRHARLRYGDRYDYSLAVFRGSNKPITIICRVCGPFTLSQASSHIRGRLCGCKFCNKKTSLRKKGPVKVCPRCRKWAKYKSCVSGLCRECQDTKNAETKAARELLLNRECRFCGYAMDSTDPRKAFCSNRCSSLFYGRVRSELNVVQQCGMCGISVERTPRKAIDNWHCPKCKSKKAAMERQRRAAAILPVLYRCTDCGSVGSLNRWAKCCPPQCNECEWTRAIYAWLARARKKQRDVEARRIDPWTATIIDRLIERPPPIRQRNSPTPSSFGQAINWQLMGVRAKRSYFNKCEWTKKIENKLSNLRKRRRVKHVRNARQGSSNQGQIGEIGLSMRSLGRATQRRLFCD